MAANRADPFADEAGLDLSDFPRPEAAPRRAVPKESVKQVSEKHRFTSREMTPAPAPAPERRTRRRFTTGRNMQFNAKVDQATHDRLYALLVRLGETGTRPATLGDVLERAAAALESELDRQAAASVRSAKS